MAQHCEHNIRCDVGRRVTFSSSNALSQVIVNNDPGSG